MKAKLGQVCKTMLEDEKVKEILERQKYSISYQDAAAFKAAVEVDDKRIEELIKAAGLAKK